MARDEYSLSLIPGTDAALVRIPSDVPGSVPRHLADAIYAFFLPEQIAHALLLRSQSVDDHRIAEFLAAQPGQTVHDIEKQLARVVKSSPSCHLTFSLFTAGGTPSSWEVQKALDEHVRPLISAMAAAVQVDVATQVQLYSSFSLSIKPLL